MTSASLEDRLLIAVTYDETKGYIGSHAEMQTFSGLSLNGLRRKIEESLLPESPVVILHLDRAAKRERDQRRSRSR